MLQALRSNRLGAIRTEFSKLAAHKLPPALRLLAASMLGAVDAATKLLDAGLPADALAEGAPQNRTPLLAATIAGQNDIVSLLLARGADPVLADDEGNVGFLVPVLTDNLPMQRIFLAAGVSPDLASSQGGVTALMVAAGQGNRGFCELLLDSGADIDQLMASGEPFFSHPLDRDFDMPALGCAANCKQWEMAGYLLDRGAKPNFGVMWTDIALTLAKYAPVALVEKMHGAGYSIVMDHQFLLLFAPPVEMNLPEMRSKIVFWAAVNPDPAVLPWVLAHGGDPMAGNTLGMTPLIVAAAAGNAGLVEQLLSGGADMGAEDCDGDTALSLAVERGSAAVVMALRRHSAQTLPITAHPLTLHQAAAEGALCMVLDVLDKGVSPNLTDAERNTPLMLAAAAGRVGAVRVLYALGASVRPRNVHGQSAWDLASEQARVRISLREFGADDPKKRNNADRIDAFEQSRGRYSHPFKMPQRNP